MRINQLPAATGVAQNDVLAIDTQNGTYRVPRSVLAPSPYVATIPTGQWSGSGNDYYITVNASNVTADSILVPCYDADSRSRLNGPVWCIPAAGSFTIHTSAIPSDTVTILVQFPGVMGEAQYQVLADVYSKSQAVAKADVVNNLTSTVTDKPLSAAQGKALYDMLTTDMVMNVYGSQPYTISAGGTIGEYLTSQTFTAAQVDGYSVRFVTIENFNHPGNYSLMLSFNMNTRTARVDMYRASTSAISLSNADFTVRFYYVRV